MNRRALAIAATAAVCAAVASTAFAGRSLQGPQLTGFALQSIMTNQPIVTAVTLPSGETAVLRPQAAD